MLNREQILRALIRLAAVLESRGVQGELYLVRGAAIALAYDARRATRDVDAVFAPSKPSTRRRRSSPKNSTCPKTGSTTP
jgi:hypothetical protein